MGEKGGETRPTGRRGGKRGNEEIGREEIVRFDEVEDLERETAEVGGRGRGGGGDVGLGDGEIERAGAGGGVLGEDAWLVEDDEEEEDGVEVVEWLHHWDGGGER